ncbi:hypothetical protein IM793_15110 [Pedobacter sp. MR2016-19]|uniref:hypothetical protein n=1 Tax=Pedobacter sp. MR2016-19 TaxID=2780089 RepID=UPI0018749969|nr:hypothetical protein [Pedobacter sp. MR2016-19]MBE5320494.1 hypothetical protein [Pedobacter sp. MR2016-19]
MKNIPRLLIQFLIVLLLATAIVTLYFIYSFGALADKITFAAILQTIKQFGLVISIPTAILFVLADFLIRKIQTVWVLYLVRCIVFFGILSIVSLVLSFYLISNALLDNPFVK